MSGIPQAELKTHCGPVTRRRRWPYMVIGLLGLFAASSGRTDVTAAIFAEDPQNRARFGDGLGGTWVFIRHQDQGMPSCVLERTPVGYGTARFLATAASGLRFELIGTRDMFAPGPVALNREAPPWHPQHPLREIVAELHQVRGFGASAGAMDAARMLTDLYQGYDQVVYSPGVYDSRAALRVRIAAVNFRTPYRQFIACQQGLSANVTLAALDRSRFHFNHDDHGLSAADLQRLGQLVRLIKADPRIARVFVDGHTDASGSERHNVGLSKRRAQAVARELASLGLSLDRLVVRYHAHRYPVASNRDAAGREQNRRTTVRLERNSSQLAQY